jgi:hypothetical protein
MGIFCFLSLSRLLIFDKFPFTRSAQHHLDNVKAYHDSVKRLSVDELSDLLASIRGLFDIHQTGKELSAAIAKLIKDVLGCEVPFDVSLILAEIDDGDKVDAHVDFGMCPWKCCSGKTDSGDRDGVNTSLLGKFYHGLDRCILSSMLLLLSNNQT